MEAPRARVLGFGPFPCCCFTDYFLCCRCLARSIAAAWSRMDRTPRSLRLLLSVPPGSFLFLLSLLQVVPPGFHLVPLPFRDDIRAPECDPALVGRVTAAGGRSGPPRADQQQVRRACSGMCARCELGRNSKQGGVWDGSRRAQLAATRRPAAGEAGLVGSLTCALCDGRQGGEGR